MKNALALFALTASIATANAGTCGWNGGTGGIGVLTRRACDYTAYAPHYGACRNKGQKIYFLFVNADNDACTPHSDFCVPANAVRWIIPPCG